MKYKRYSTSLSSRATALRFLTKTVKSKIPFTSLDKFLLFQLHAVLSLIVVLVYSSYVLYPAHMLRASFPAKLLAEFTRDSSGRVWNTLAHTGAEEIHLDSTDSKSHSAVVTILACRLSTSGSPTTPWSSFSKSKLICLLLICLKSCANLSHVQLSTISAETITLCRTSGGKVLSKLLSTSNRPVEQPTEWHPTVMLAGNIQKKIEAPFEIVRFRCGGTLHLSLSLSHTHTLSHSVFLFLSLSLLFRILSKSIFLAILPFLPPHQVDCFYRSFSLTLWLFLLI